MDSPTPTPGAEQAPATGASAEQIEAAIAKVPSWNVTSARNNSFMIFSDCQLWAARLVPPTHRIVPVAVIEAARAVVAEYREYPGSAVVALGKIQALENALEGVTG